MMWAYVLDGLVAEVSDIDPKGRFHESLIWVKCPSGVGQGWLYDGSKFVAPIEPEQPTDIVPDEISRRQFFQQLAVLEIITRQEALDALDGAIPAPLQAIIDQLPTEDDKFNAQMLVKGAQNFIRTNPLAEIVRQAMQWTVEQKDNFWRDAAKL